MEVAAPDSRATHCKLKKQDDTFYRTYKAVAYPIAESLWNDMSTVAC
jgi:hypothetical protein